MDYYINAMFCLLLIISLENGMVGLVANRAEYLFEVCRPARLNAA